jgi:peptidoglycan pentaglycine glycine transferase (the first glycine)
VRRRKCTKPSPRPLGQDLLSLDSQSSQRRGTRLLTQRFSHAVRKVPQKHCGFLKSARPGYNALAMLNPQNPQARHPASIREWDQLVQQLSGGLLQSWAWGEFKSHFGWQPERVAVTEGNRVTAAAQILFRRLPGGLWTTAYVPRGPLLDPSATSDSGAQALFCAVHEACQRRRAAFLKVEPDWEEEAQARCWLESHDFRSSPQTVQPQRTVLVDLRPDEQSILAQMKPKTRYNIHLAERKGVRVNLSTVDGLPRFYRLLQITGQRDGFGIHTQEYYAQAYRCFIAQDAVALFEALYQEQTLAALMVFAWGKKAWYMYGASANAERQRMPNHLLQWEAMRWAKARGCEVYDLWGIPDVNEDQVGGDVAAAEEQGVLSAGMGGLYRFKRGFGGRVARYIGAWDHIYHGPLYHALATAWRWRKALQTP